MKKTSKKYQFNLQGSSIIDLSFEGIGETAEEALVNAKSNKKITSCIVLWKDIRYNVEDLNIEDSCEISED